MRKYDGYMTHYNTFPNNKNKKIKKHGKRVVGKHVSPSGKEYSLTNYGSGSVETNR